MWDKDNVCGRIIFYNYWCKTILISQPDAPWFMRIFPMAGYNRSKSRSFIRQAIVLLISILLKTQTSPVKISRTFYLHSSLFSSAFHYKPNSHSAPNIKLQLLNSRRLLSMCNSLKTPLGSKLKELLWPPHFTSICQGHGLLLPNY